MGPVWVHVLLRQPVIATDVASPAPRPPRQGLLMESYRPLEVERGKLGGGFAANRKDRGPDRSVAVGVSSSHTRTTHIIRIQSNDH